MKEVTIKSKIVGRGGASAATSPGKGVSVDMSGYLLKQIWEKVFEFRLTDDGTEYLFAKMNVAAQGGFTSFVDGGKINLPGLYDGIPFDNRTIWMNPETGVVEVLVSGGEGGAAELDEILKLYATKTELQEVAIEVEGVNAGIDEAKISAQEAYASSIEAKNAVKTLEGLSNTTEAQQTLAAQVLQIEENKQNIGEVTIDLNEIKEQKYCLGKDGWYYAGTGKHKAIPVDGYSRVRITCGGVGQYIGFLTSNYSVPTSQSAVPYSSFEPYRIWQYENTTTYYEIPSDCAYLVLGTEDGSGNLGTYQEIVLYSELGLRGKMAHSQLYENVAVNIDNYTARKCSLSSKWYSEKGLGVHKAIPVSGYSRVQVKASGGNGGGWIGFVTSSYKIPQNGETIPFSYRYPTRIWQDEGAVVTYDTCPDIAFLIVCIMDGGGNQPAFDVWLETDKQIQTQGVVSQLVKDNEKLNEKLNKVDAPVSIDLGSVQAQSGVLGSAGWYIDSSVGAKHKAIPVKGGSMITIEITGNKGSYIGFLTDAYVLPYSTNDKVPYCAESPNRIWQYENTSVSYNIPEDCKYVVVSMVDGGGNSVSYGDVKIYGYNGESISLQEFANDMRNNGGTSGGASVARLKVMAWNIGHYCYGTGTTSAVNSSNYLEQRTAYRNLFNEQGVDLVGLVEYSDVFNTSTGESAIKAIIPQYANKFFGDVKASGYVCNGIVTNAKVTNIEQILLPNDYYAIEGNVKYMDSDFKVCVVHLPWQTEAMNVESAQILIDRYANDSKVIVMGDFNIYDTSLYDMFSNAGYDLGNHGYIGDIVTRPQTGTFLDNVMVKGGKILKTVVPMTELSDHLPVVCDIVI